MPENEPLAWRGSHAVPSRLAAPAQLFRAAQEPPFVLLDARGWETDALVARTVYVSHADEPALNEYLRRRLRAMLGDETLDPEARAWGLLRVLVAEAERALDAAPRAGALTELTPLCHTAIEQLLRDPGRYLASLAQPRAPAEVAVARAFYAVALAAAEGVREPEALTALAVAGLFADAGLRGLPEGLLAREAELDEDERVQLHSHPDRSAEVLRRAGVRAALALRAVRAHHEQWGGGGYPLGLAGAEIPTEGRMLGIADTFVGLTGEGAGRPALRAYEALMEMSRVPGRFEPRLLRAFVRMLGRALGSGERWIAGDRREEPPAHVA